MFSGLMFAIDYFSTGYYRKPLVDGVQYVLSQLRWQVLYEVWTALESKAKATMSLVENLTRAGLRLLM
jgi:hypothetical protein